MSYDIRTGKEIDPKDLHRYKKENVTYVKEGNGYYYIDVYGVKNVIQNGTTIYLLESDNVKDAQGNVLKDAVQYAGENLDGKNVRDSLLNIKERFVAEPYYSGSCQVAAGKRYHVFIYDMSKDYLAQLVNEQMAVLFPLEKEEIEVTDQPEVITESSGMQEP